MNTHNYFKLKVIEGKERFPLESFYLGNDDIVYWNREMLKLVKCWIYQTREELLKYNRDDNLALMNIKNDNSYIKLLSGLNMRGIKIDLIEC